MYKGNEGKCFGKWDIKDPACSTCLIFVRMKCENVTKRKRAESALQPANNVVSVADKMNEINEYFFGVLESTLGSPRVNWGESMVTHFYYSQDGKSLLIFVACNKSTGMMKVSSPKIGDGKKGRVVSLESTEQANALVKELVG